MSYEEHAERVTASLVNMIANDEGDTWSMPWHSHGFADHLRARNATTQTGYRGANVITLAVAGIERGFPTGEWATYRQWQSVDGQVRKSERSTQIVKWIPNSLDGDEVPGAAVDGDNQKRLIPRVYSVFNVHQIDGIEPTEQATVDADTASEWVASIGADVVYGGDRAYYTVGADRIYVPGIEQYDDHAAHWATVIHEHLHWTGHPTRLDRDLRHPFGSLEYAAEELVAELGAAIACARLGVSVEPREDHAAYLSHWLKILGEDPKALFRSAAAAQRAIDYLDAAAATPEDPGSNEVVSGVGAHDVAVAA